MITLDEMRAIRRAMADAETVIVEREIDRAVFEQGLKIMRDLQAMRANKIFLAWPGRCLPHASAVETTLQGPNPAPAPNNPNADCYDQVAVTANTRGPSGRTLSDYFSRISAAREGQPAPALSELLDPRVLPQRRLAVKTPWFGLLLRSKLARFLFGRRVRNGRAHRLARCLSISPQFRRMD